MKSPLLASVLVLSALASPALALEDLKTFAAKVEETLGKGDASFVDSRTDIQEIVRRATDKVQAPGDFYDGFLRGAAKTSILGKQLALTVQQGGSVRVLRVRESDSTVLLRVIPGSGVNYLELEVDPRSHKIVDIYNFLSGEKTTQAVRRLFVMGLGDSKQGLLDRIRGKERALLDNVDAVKRMWELFSAKDYKKTLAIYDSLPESLRRERSFQVVRVTCAGAVDDDKLYERVMEDFEKLYPNDPSLDLVGIDRFYLRKEWDQVLATVNRLDRRVHDPYLNVFRGNVWLEQGEYAKAKASYQAALDGEPTLIDAHWSMISLALKQSQFKEVTRLLTKVERDLGVPLNDLQGQAEYAAYVKSPEYKVWRRGRAKYALEK